MKKRRMKKLNNKGYSLVELIIVIAIIVVLTGAAMITLNVMHSAKAKEAAITFDSEISELINKSKNRACDPNDDGVISEDPNGDGDLSDSEKNYTFGLRLHRVDNKCFLQEVLVKDGVYVENDAYEKANNPNDGNGLSLSIYVNVTYTDLDGNVITIGDQPEDTVLISYKRNGTCATGFGTYEFTRTSGGAQVASMTLNKNGSHQSN